MSKIANWVKKIKLSQIVVTFLAGVLLVVSTACNGSVQANTPGSGARQEVPSGTQPTGNVKAGDNPRPEVPGEATTNRFRKGTMNEFSDLDPRAKNVEEVSNKAEALKQNAERNVIDQTSNVGENTKRILDKKGENAEEFNRNIKQNAESAKDKLQGTAEDIKRGTQKGTENIKDNTYDATKGVNRAAENAKQTVKANTPDTSELRSGTKQALDNTKSAGKNLANDTQNNIEKTGNFVQNKLNEAARGAKQNLDKAGNVAKDALD